MAESREQIASREVGHTDISPWLSRALTAVFLASIVLVPVLQTASDISESRKGARNSAVPQNVDALRLPFVGVRALATAEGDPLARLFAANREVLSSIHTFDDALEERSVVGKWIRPRLQRPLARIFDVGNEQVYCGRSQWLFYRPAVDHLTGPGFLDQNQLARRAASGNEWQEAPQPDPLPSILEFRDQLAGRGIELLVVPVPVKASIHPELLSARYTPGGAAVHNPSYREFLSRLDAEGVRTFDPTSVLGEAGVTSGKAQYLATDTHWTPQAVDWVAKHLASTVREMVELPPGGSVLYGTRNVEVSNIGDLAEMLELPSLYPAQTVSIEMVEAPTVEEIPTGGPAEILLLGDSFANIYQQDTLGWGAHGGLAQRLAFRLQQPVDSLIRNDDGAFATRLLLSQEINEGNDPLTGVRVVIWEFTARELSVGDWRSVPLAKNHPATGAFVVPPRGTTLIVEGTVAALAEVPNPRTAPYADFIVGIHLVDLSSSEIVEGDEAMVFTWAMRDRQLTQGADYRVGQRIRLHLRPWADVAQELGSITRGEIFDDNLFLQTPCWGMEANP